MAKVEQIVPFILKWETGTVDKTKTLTNEALFNIAKAKGYSNDPFDLGGPTMCGVTLSTYTSFRSSVAMPKPTIKELKAITYPEWLTILKIMFWNRWKADEINNDSVANILVDFVWASGKYGITVPQKALNVTADGIVGPKTLKALNSLEPRKAFDLIKSERVAYIDRICKARPANEKYRKGWLNRINDIEFKNS